MKTVILLLAAMLVGCASHKTIIQTPVLPVDPAVNQGCDPIAAAPAHGANMGQLYQALDDLVGAYGICATRDAAKSKWIKSQGH